MRKFFASIISFIMFWLIMLSCSLFTIRNILNEETINKVVTLVSEAYKEENGNELFVTEFVSPFVETYPELPNYFSEEEIKEEVITMLNTALENLGNKEADMIVDTSSLKKMIKENMNDYGKSTGVIIPDNIIDEGFVTFDETYNITRESLGEAVIIFELIYSDKIMLYLLAGIGLCIVLIFVILGKIKETLNKIKTPIILNGVGNLFMGYSIASVLSSMKLNEMTLPNTLTEIFATPFYKLGATLLVLGIGLMIASKVLKHNKSVENSNDAIENLGNSNQPNQGINNNYPNVPSNQNYYPNNNIQNPPYTGSNFQ